MQTLLSDELISDLNARFEERQPQDILRWLFADSGLERVAIASAFQAEGTAVIHMATRIRPDVPILFLETGFHFRETLEFKRHLTDLFELNVVDLRGDHTPESQARAFGPRLYERDPARCCELNKVTPFNRALEHQDAWVTAMRRDSAWTRRDTPIVSRSELDSGHMLLKVNPITNWKRRDVWRYLREHEIPHHPLYDLGYPSIGCAPCTRIVYPGEDERAGRWSGLLNTECGIHVEEIRRQEAGKRAAPVGMNEAEPGSA